MPNRPVAQGPYTLASTSTAVLGYAEFGTGMQSCSVYYNDYGSTLNVALKVDGTIGRSALWAPLVAVTTLSTNGGVLTSTGTAVFDQIRISCTVNGMNSTNTGSLICWALAR